MTHLSIHLLGPFHVTLDEEAVTEFESSKVRALLAYLAVEAARPHSRDSLAGLLWPDQPDRTARRNLSQALFNLRQTIHDAGADPPFLRVTRRTVQFNPDSDHWLDVTAFTAHVAASEAHAHPRLETCEPCMERLAQAVELYRGEFLAGFFVGDSVPFEEWATLLRERFHRQVLDALYHLAAYHERRRDYERARHYARRQVELEPW
jgi:DNA-binding SARP family transcriptional activator